MRLPGGGERHCRSCFLGNSRDHSWVLCFQGSALTAHDVCDKTDCRLFLQESEGFGDRLFLKQRMSLLSQLTSTPIDCLFQVRHTEVLRAQICEGLSILPHLCRIHQGGLCSSVQGFILCSRE